MDNAGKTEPATARIFIQKLIALKTKKDLENVKRFYRDEGTGNKFIGVRMAGIFELSRQFSHLPLSEIKKLLQSDYYEARMGGVGIMDIQARNKKTGDAHKKNLFDLYISSHHRINNWDLVDRGAPYVVGGYLHDKPRTVLYKLARSKNVWERRTAIVSTYFFIRQNDLSDTFRIAEILVNDEHDLIQKAVGSWVREAGKKDKPALIEFLDVHSPTMPRTTLRYAIEKLDKREKTYYLKNKNSPENKS